MLQPDTSLLPRIESYTVKDKIMGHQRAPGRPGPWYESLQKLTPQAHEIQTCEEMISTYRAGHGLDDASRNPLRKPPRNARNTSPPTSLGNLTTAPSRDTINAYASSRRRHSDLDNNREAQRANKPSPVPGKGRRTKAST